MKITKETLKKIIQEEIEKVLKEEASETTGQMLKRTADKVGKTTQQILDEWLRGETDYTLYTHYISGEPKDGILLSKDEADYVLDRGGIQRIVEAYVEQP